MQNANPAPQNPPINHHHRSALASLKLATYALDAMRVFNHLEAQAKVSESFRQAMGSACADWRNPGSLEQDPADLLVSVMTYSLDTLQGLVNQLEEAWAEGVTSPFEQPS